MRKLINILGISSPITPVAVVGKDYIPQAGCILVAVVDLAQLAGTVVDIAAAPGKIVRMDLAPPAAPGKAAHRHLVVHTADKVGLVACQQLRQNSRLPAAAF